MKERKASTFIIWPFVFFLLIPISGISIFSYEVLYISIEEIALAIFLLWFFVFNKVHTTYKEVVGIVLFIVYCLLFALPLVTDGSAFDFLKEVKPFVFIFAVFLFLIFKNKSYLITQEKLVMILSFSIAVDVMVWFFLINSPELMPEGIRKEFFIRNEIYRYSDFATLLLQTLTILAFYQYRNKTLKMFYILILYLILVFLTQDRMYLFFGFIVFLFYSSRQIKLFIVVVTIMSGFLFGSALNSIESNEVSLRFYNLIDFEAVLNELFLRFILPAAEGGYEWSLYSIFLGYGIDFKFYIPWYEYRGLDVYHNSVDSFFVTFFVKNGLIGVIIFLYIVHVSLKGQPRVIYLWVFFYLVIHNGLYVGSFLLMIVFLSFLYVKPST